MIILLYLQIMLRLAEPYSGLDIHLLDALNVVMLMVRFIQDFQWRHHMPAERMPRAKPNCQKLFREIIGYDLSWTSVCWMHLVLSYQLLDLTRICSGGATHLLKRCLGQNLIIRSCQEKQLVMTYPQMHQDWSSHTQARMQSVWILVPAKELI